MSNTSIEKQLEEIIEAHPELDLKKTATEYYLSGEYEYNLIWNGVIRKGMKDLEITVPFSFPLAVPKVFINDKPSGMNHIYKDNSVCLATIGEIIEFLSTNPTIKDFVEKFVDAFLFSMSWFENYGCYPFGERQHGWKGLKSYYTEDWGLTSEQYWELVSIIIQNRYKGHHPCICDSGLKTRTCHGIKILPIISNDFLRQQFIDEAVEIYKGENNETKQNPPRRFI